VLRAVAPPIAPGFSRSALPELPPAPERRGADAESVAWVEALSGAGRRHDEAVAALHALLLRAARFEVARRGGGRSGDSDDLATQAADDALMAIMRKLHTYRGDSRFTTWAYKFALLEAAVKVRRRAWHEHEIPLEAEGWRRLANRRTSPQADVESSELIAAVCDGMAEALTPHQRTVLVALALNGVPIDVLADRLGTTRGALYKTLHDARRKLRARLSEHGLALESTTQGGRS
jgi:RNA polymerase sigma-70 factor, ECF subfamily